MNNNNILADEKLRNALDSIVIELNGHGIGPDNRRFIEWHCDEDLRQRYGDEKLMEMAYRRFHSCSPVLSEKATKWFNQFNAEYFDSQLLPHYVWVHYGHEMLRPLGDHDDYLNLNIYGAWEDDGIVYLLLYEMIDIATEMDRQRLKQAEFERLKKLGAQFPELRAIQERASWNGLDGPRSLSDSQPGEGPHPAWGETAELWQADRKIFKSRLADVSFAKK
jgi:hypothetical protein